MSTHDRVFKQLVDDRLLRDQEFRDNVYEVLANLKDDFYNREEIDVYFQHFRKGFDVYDAECLRRIRYGLGTGRYAKAMVYVGQGPAADAELEENRRRIAALSGPFVAEVWCGLADEDGAVRWSETIQLGQQSDPNPPIIATVRPGRCPLEIGYTKPSRTLLHLEQDSGLARWPYGHDHVTLILKVKDDERDDEVPMRGRPHRPPE